MLKFTSIFALTYDVSYQQGECGGEPHFLENPVTWFEDIRSLRTSLEKTLNARSA